MWTSGDATMATPMRRRGASSRSAVAAVVRAGGRNGPFERLVARAVPAWVGRSSRSSASPRRFPGMRHETNLGRSLQAGNALGAGVGSHRDLDAGAAECTGRVCDTWSAPVARAADEHGTARRWISAANGSSP